MPHIISNFIELHICFREKEEYLFLLLKRSPGQEIYPGIWQMITGGIEENESAKDAVVRELFEETGLRPEKIYSTHRVNSFYLEFMDAICFSPVFLVFVGSKDVRLSDEHTEYKWAGFEEAAKLIHWPNQAESLKAIMEYLGDKKLFSKLIEIKV